MAGLHFESVEAVFDPVVRQHLFQRGCVDAGFQAGEDLAAGIRVNDHPSFRLAALSRKMRSALNVVRMHLNRQPVIGIEKFDQ